MNCYQCKALYSAEAQVMRHGRIVGDLIKLLKNARDDGGLTTAQCERMDRLLASAEAVMVGRDHSEDHTELLRELAIAIGPIGDEDRTLFSPEVELEASIPFGLMLRLSDAFGDDIHCACSGSPEARTVVMAGAES